MKDIEPDVDPEQRIGYSEGPAVTKTQVGIPVGVETDREEQSDAGTDHTNSQLQKPRRKIDTDLRGRIEFGQIGRRPCAAVLAESGAVSDSLTEIEPQVQKGEDESQAQHRPLNRQQRPEDVGVVELPHPQPFLYIAGDNSQDDDE